ncbi:MAG: sulfite exporter TauE/SafE family protein [Phycisphaerales bacterium]
MHLTILIGGLLIGACLGLLGSGGSILTVPVLVYLLGHEAKPAIAESLAIVGLIAAGGSIRPIRRGCVDWKSVVFFGVPAMAGTVLGAWIAGWVSPYVQLLTFALVMVAASIAMLRQAGRPAGASTTRRPRVGLGGLAMIATEGIGVGALTGFVGVGGGFLVVPALVMLGGLAMPVAVGTSLLIIAIKSASGFAKYMTQLEGSIDWTTIWLFAGIGSLGSVAGAALGGRLNERMLKRVFAIVVLVMGAGIAAIEVGKLVAAPEPSEAEVAEPGSAVGGLASPGAADSGSPAPDEP